MNKFNFAKLGNDLNFSPVMNRHNDIIANEATLTLEDSTLIKHFPSSRLNEVKDQLDLYYKRLAVESYSDKLPLILSTSEWLHQSSASAPRPLFFEITVVYQSVWISLYYYEPTSSYGMKIMPSRQIGQGLQSLPLLLQSGKASFVILSRQFPQQQNHFEIASAFSRVLEYFCELGLEVIAAGISTRKLSWFPDPKRFLTNSSVSRRQNCPSVSFLQG